jgi:hypothetical protein
MFDNTRVNYTLALLHYQTARFKDMTPDDNLYSSLNEPKKSGSNILFGAIIIDQS